MIKTTLFLRSKEGNLHIFKRTFETEDSYLEYKRVMKKTCTGDRLVFQSYTLCERKRRK